MLNVTPKLRHAIIGVIVSIVFVSILASITGFITFHNQYSPDPKGPSAQVEALCAGRISISENPEQILLDYVYYDGKVQQIWGLGVPLLQSPVLCLIPIPDRVFLFLFLCIAAFFIYWQSHRDSVLRGVLSLFFILFLPAAVSLMRTRFLVYEETIYYGYIISVCMFFLARMSFRHAYAVAIVGLMFGAAGSVRPTMAIYGFVSAVIMFITLRSSKFRIVLVAGFMIGLSFILVTNYMRFGSFTEFGHTQNLSYDDTVNTYQLKFDYAYKNESFIGAGKELFGILFLSRPTIRGPYLPDKFPLQSDTTRWRSAYNYAYNPAYLVLLIAAIVLWRDKKEILWIMIPGLALSGFYLFSPSISTRYMIDFAPIFSVAAILLLASVSRFSGRKKVVVMSLVGVIFCIWLSGLSAEFNQKKKSDNIPRSTPIVRDYIRSNNLSQISDVYQKGDFVKSPSLFNGSGWKTIDGAASSSVMLFFNNPKEIIASFEGECGYLDYVLQLRIGNDLLNPLILKKNVYSFSIPEQYQQGVWPLFLKLLPVEKVQENTDKCTFIEIKNL